MCSFSLLSSLFFYYFFLFFLGPNFFFAFALLIFFNQQGAHKNKPQKFELNWIKDVAYRNQDSALKSMPKLVGPETRFS